MKIINIVGARPNFMKVAPIHRLMEESKIITPILVHTGQHYDERMSKVFFDDLGMPEPAVYLKVGSASHAVQTAKIMTEFEQVCIEHKPDIVLVVGDVNSTTACSLVASKLGIKVVHIESGLRSFDNDMPEELNRKVTDVLSDFLFVSERSGLINLNNEGIAPEKIVFVGNVMIDSLVKNLERASKESTIMEDIGVKENGYILTTLHRPSNVDDEVNTKLLIEIFHEVTKYLDVVFPIHPRSQKNFEKFGLMEGIKANKKIHLIEPAAYLDFIKLMQNSKLLLTDSGGIQEETTYLKKPCLTLRENTERPSTITEGTNVLIEKLDKDVVLGHVKTIMDGNWKTGTIPEFWDGKTAERIVAFLEKVKK